jgi:3-oxoacyl-[acyl-carrier-protein] synthase II
VMCREIEMGVAAAQKALANSGLGDDRDPDRCGCLFGCDYILSRPEEYADGVNHCRAQSGGEFHMADWPDYGLFKVNPLWLLKYLPNMPNSHVSIYNDFRGPNNSITVREASMNLCLAEAASIIQRGAADVMLVGATGTRIHPIRCTVETMTGDLASERSDAAEMARPFDESSDGTVLGEGAGALMLESLEYAEARGAKIWGEIVGCGSAMVGPQAGPTGERDFLRESIRLALRSAIHMAGERLPSSWHIHAQGLSSRAADSSEGLAISDVLADFDSVPVTAAKSYFGNLGAGSAAVELICSLLAIENNQLFAIKNLKKPASYAAWQPAVAGGQAGQGVVHSSFTLQGQASSIVVVAA